VQERYLCVHINLEVMNICMYKFNITMIYLGKMRSAHTYMHITTKALQVLKTPINCAK